MKEIKVEKDVVLKNRWYYTYEAYNEINDIIDSIFSESEEVVNKNKNKAYDLYIAKKFLYGITMQLENDVIIFKCKDKNYDIDKAIKNFNDKFNSIIREFINKEGT